MARASFYRPELDSLRFFAFLAVFVFHLIPAKYEIFFARHGPQWLAHAGITVVGAGKFGVDLFFTLSAFLITELLLRERAAFGHLNVRAFYMRRMLRIWPLYFFFLLLATVVEHGRSGTAYILAYLLLAGNWLCAFRGLPPSAISPLWSVSIEEQFYLLWPLVVRRASLRTIWRFGALMLVVATGTRFFLLSVGQGKELWFNTVTRLEPFAFGIMLAVFLHDRDLSLRNWTRAAVLSCGLLLWVVATLVAPMLSYLLVGIGSLQMLVAVIGGPKDGRGPLRWAPLTYLGRISYGLYVYHVFVIRQLTNFWGIPEKSLTSAAAFAALSTCATIGLAAASYKWLECPFLRLKARFTLVASRPL